MLSTKVGIHHQSSGDLGLLQACKFSVHLSLDLSNEACPPKVLANICIVDMYKDRGLKNNILHVVTLLCVESIKRPITQYLCFVFCLSLVPRRKGWKESEIFCPVHHFTTRDVSKTAVLVCCQNSLGSREEARQPTIL